MAERKVYSCHWCTVDSPLGSRIPQEWSVVKDTDCGYPDGHLCQKCKDTRIQAIQEARASRFRETHPSPSSGKGGA